jgi:hypothetical protein
MRKQNIALSLAAAAPAVAALISSCAASQHVPGRNLTVRCTDTLTAVDATNWAVSGHGHCTLTGALHESGPEITYRAQTAEAISIRRVITGAKGTITFVIKIPQIGGGGEPWTITSGTGAYAKLHGHGLQVVDNYQATPATFVLKGTVSQV